MHRGCWCGSSCSVLQKWYEIRTKFAQNSYKIRTNFVRNSYEIRANFVQIFYENSPQSTVITYRECGCYKFRTKFVRISNNLHEFVSFFSRTNTLSP